MASRVNIHGDILLPQDAKISAFDQGFLFGTAVFEVLRTYGGRPFLLGARLRRLRASAEAVGLQGLPEDAVIAQEIEHTLRAAGNDEAQIRLVATAGGCKSCEFGVPDIQEAHVIIYVSELPVIEEKYRLDGVDVLVPTARSVSVKAMPGWIRSNNRLTQLRALAEGRRKGAFEVLRTGESGFMTDGAQSNLFFMRGNVLCTPSISVGLHPGLTRALVLGLARQADIATKQGNFRPGDVMGAEEAFLTNHLLEVIPIRRVDGQPIEHCSGPVTRALQDSFRLVTQRSASASLTEAEVLELLGEDPLEVGEM